MSPRISGQEGAIPFVVVGVGTLASVLGLAWLGQEWAHALLREAGGELSVFALRSAFWTLDLVALQASMEPVSRDWYSPVLNGVALPIYTLAALVMVATLIAEVVAGMATGNTVRMVQAVFRALIAGMLASAGGTLLLALGGGLSTLGRIALAASGTTVDAPLIPLQEVLMDSALQREGGAELFVVFLAAVVIVLSSLAIYFTLAMRPVLLAALIVFLPVAHALSVWTPLRRVQVRAWALAVAVLLADAAILTMFAITNTVAGHPEGVDRLIFGTFGVLLAALAPAALARIVGTPELQTAVHSLARGPRVAAMGAGMLAGRSVLSASRQAKATSGTGGGGGRGGPSMASGGSDWGMPGPGGTPPRSPATPSGGGGAGTPALATARGGTSSGRATSGAGTSATTGSGTAGPSSNSAQTSPGSAPTTARRSAGGWQDAVSGPRTGTRHG